MSRKRWHMRTEGALTLHARHWPPRFDVQATTVLSDAQPERLALQIRQDLWRALQNLRGFSPVVQVERRAGELHVTAGGRVAGAVCAQTQARIAELLADPVRRRRWVSWARLRP